MIKEIKATLKNFRPSDKQLRMFGIVFAAIFLVIGLSLENSSAVPTATIAFGGIAFAVAVFYPRLLFPVSFALMSVTVPIGWIVSRAILIAFFYAILTPVSVVLRVAGLDPLQLKKRPKESYWVDFEENRNPNTMGL